MHPIETPANGSRDLGQIIARNYVFGVAAQIFIRFLAWLFQIYVIRGLGPEVYGRYTQVLAFMAIFSVFGDLGISNYASREIAKNHGVTKELFWNVRLIRFLLAFLVLFLAAGSAWILNRPQDLIIGVIVASCELFLYVFQGTSELVLRGFERLDYVSLLVMLSQALFLVSGMFVMLNNLGYLGLVLATWPGTLAFALVGEWLIRRKLAIEVPLQINPRRWGGLVRAGVPFGLTTFTNMLSFRLDTILLGVWITNTAVGYYNAAYNLIFTLLTFTGTLNNALLPSLSRVYVDDPQKTQRIYQRVIGYLFILSMPIAVGTTILAKEIILTLYGEALSGSILPLQILIWVLPLLTFTSLCGSITTVFHLERKTARINVINAVANLSMNLIAIPTLGILGASITTVMTELLGLFQFGYVLREHFVWMRLVKSLLKPLFASLIMGLAVFLTRDLVGLWSILLGIVIYIGINYALGVWNLTELRSIGQTMRRSVV